MSSPFAAFLVGFVLSATNLYGSRVGIKVAAQSFAGAGRLGWGTAFVVLLGLVKLPLLIVAGLWYMRQPSPAPGWFLAGFGLVYSVLIVWALARSKSPDDPP